MKVIVDAVPMSGLLTGIARYLRNLYAVMEGMEDVDLFYFNGRSVKKSMPNLPDSVQHQRDARIFRSLPVTAGFGLRTCRWLMYEHNLNRVCRKKKTSGFDVYHETSFTPARLSSPPTLFSIYDLSVRRYKETHPGDRVLFFEHFLKTRLQYAGHILTISKFVKEEIIEEFNLSPSMITVAPPAPDPRFRPLSPDKVKMIRVKYGLPQSYLLFVSSLEPRKNIDLLIRALQDAATDIPLVLVGWQQAWGKKEWLEKVDATSIGRRIYILGHLPDEDLAAVYNGAAALVYPSLYEGFGLPIVEAMACGCPVICSDTASMPEAAGDAALLIDPRKSEELTHAIETIVHDTGLANSLVDKGFKQAQRFTWEASARKTLDLFRQMV